MSRRRGGGPQLAVIWWRDIPAQVVATHADETVRVELPARFVQAIDRAAMRGGMVGSDAYLEQWDRRARPCGEDLRAEVDAEVERIESDYPSAVLTELVRATPAAATSARAADDQEPGA